MRVRCQTFCFGLADVLFDDILAPLFFRGPGHLATWVAFAAPDHNSQGGLNTVLQMLIRMGLAVSCPRGNRRHGD
jgi:hypothetical protein